MGREPPGDILFDDRVISSGSSFVPSHQRDIGMVLLLGNTSPAWNGVVRGW
jgi:hypothetical protein